MPSIFACLYFTPFTLMQYAGLTETMSRKFREISRIWEELFGGSEKDCYFLKIIVVRDYKRRKLVSYFLNNAAKTWLYELKISENVEIKHVFQSQAFFFVSVAISTHVVSAHLKCTISKVQRLMIWTITSNSQFNITENIRQFSNASIFHHW